MDQRFLSFLLVNIAFLAFCLTVFSQNKPFITPFETSNNLIVVQASVNQSKPLFFILDTGASDTVISERAVKELNLKTEGQTDASAQGGSIEATFVKNASIRLSKNIFLPNLKLAAIRLNGLEAGLGRRIDGILGYEIFNSYVVEIDYAAGQLRFFTPQTYRYSGRGKIIPIVIADRTPYLQAQITPAGNQSFDGKLLINTGLTGTLAFNSPFVKQNKLLETIPNTKVITFGSILASSAAGRIGRIKNLQFGGFEINNPVTNFSQDEEGDDADTEYVGMIGSQILRRFKIIIDYSRNRIIFEPNKSFSIPYEFDMSGASLAASGENFKVFKVRSLIENSPATEAGLLVGDIITAVNGVVTDKMTLEQIRRLFRQADKTYKLSVKRNDSNLEITIKTRRIV